MTVQIALTFSLTEQLKKKNVLLFRYAEYLRLTKAAIVCQKQYRMVRDRRAYLRVRQAVVTIQAYTRGMYTRRIYWEVKRISSMINNNVALPELIRLQIKALCIPPFSFMLLLNTLDPKN